MTNGHFLNPYYVPFKYKRIALEIDHGSFTKLCHVITTPPMNYNRNLKAFTFQKLELYGHHLKNFATSFIHYRFHSYSIH